MSAEQQEHLHPRMQSALDELRGVIAQRYQSATFQVIRDPEEPDNVDLVTTVDLDDPDEVLDLLIDRLVELQVDERIPVHVIPIRTPERILAEMKERGKQRDNPIRRIASRLGRSSVSP